MKHISEKADVFKEKMKPMPNGCIEWTGNIDTTGYGRFGFDQKILLAHRVSWVLFKGEIPKDMCILHKCDNPPCVNPEHLFLGDRGENARDMAKKGRQWVQKNPNGRPICPLELKPRGEKHGNAKLSNEEVLSIRTRFCAGEKQKDLAAIFGVSKSLVNQITNHSIWRHIGGPFREKKGVLNA